MFSVGFGIFHFSRHGVLLHVIFLNINSGKLGDINAFRLSPVVATIAMYAMSCVCGGHLCVLC